MPRQDAQGRWISDDGLQYWDGSAWRPLGAQVAARKSSALPAVLIGCGFAVVVVIVLVIGLFVLVFNSADVQRGICNGLANSNPPQSCPFHLPSPS